LRFGAAVAVHAAGRRCSEDLGLRYLLRRRPAKETYSIYYRNKKWRFVFEEVTIRVKWGVHSRGRTDVPDGAANPFPLGMDMDEKSTEQQKKTWAKADLTPDAGGHTLRTKYWSEALTIQHETFHMDDWETYVRPRITEAETQVEGTQIDVTTSNLNPYSLLVDKQADFHNIYLNKTDDAWADFEPGAETRAHADGKAAYQALADSIVP